MSTRLPGFRGEYLWEIDIAERQLMALAEACPQEKYAWRPADAARSFSEVLVHVAMGNLMLLTVAGVDAAPDFYGKVEGDFLQRMTSMIAFNDLMERDNREKPVIMALMKRSFDALRAAFSGAPDEELNRISNLFGEQTAVRRVYLRLLAHLHEHMGQLIAYTRVMGMPAPWPDWRESGRKTIERGSGS